MGVARLGVVGARAAEVLHRDVLAGDGLDDVGTGDEHRRGLVDHDREVGDGGGVDVAAGAVAHDHRDLRDDAGGVHVAAEDLAVQAERDDALLDAGAGALVDADDRAAGLEREVHDLDDLLAVDLAEGAAEDGEVLREHAGLAPVDRAVAGDDAVAVGAGLLQAEGGGAVSGELVELHERALVEEHLDALAGGLAALGVLLLDRLRGARVHGLVESTVQVGELAGRGVEVDVGIRRRDVGALAGLCAHGSPAGVLLGLLGPVGQASARDHGLGRAPTPRQVPPGGGHPRADAGPHPRAGRRAALDQRHRRGARPGRCSRRARRRRRPPDGRARPARPHLGHAARHRADLLPAGASPRRPPGPGRGCRCSPGTPSTRPSRRAGWRRG